MASATSIQLHHAKPILEAQAVHGVGCIGGMLPWRETTTVTVGGRFIATLEGHAPDGFIHSPSHHSEAYRLNVVERA
jgi:hypothetical protein